MRMAEDQKAGKGPEVSYDDRPFPSTPGELPPEVQAPLAEFKGAEPPSPQWFKDAIAREPERMFVESLGSKLEVLTWGEVGKPGLLFVHAVAANRRANALQTKTDFFMCSYRSKKDRAATDRARYSLAAIKAGRPVGGVWESTEYGFLNAASRISRRSDEFLESRTSVCSATRGRCAPVIPRAARR